jgi:hypothetical protein
VNFFLQEAFMRILGIIVGLAICVSVSAAAQTSIGIVKTMTGKISDSNCKDKPHSTAEHDGKKMTDADCVGVCVKKGGKYVFVSGGTVYQLSNQNSKQIASHAGQEVELTGELKGDTINATTMKAAVTKK